MKLGLICDGVSRDLAHALKVMDEFSLEYAEPVSYTHLTLPTILRV